MESILLEIMRLRENNPITIDYKNNNRYCVIANERNNTNTIYCFSTPIYNIHTRKAIDMKFKEENGVFYNVGSNANICVSNNIHLENMQGTCSLQFNKKYIKINDRELRSNEDIIIATSNGIAYKAKCTGAKPISFDLEIQSPFTEVRANDKNFSLMCEKFKPFVSVSCIGTINSQGDIIGPSTIEYERLSNYKYRLTVKPCNFNGEKVMFEVNLYEAKLFQDTTVESKNPKINNAFGGVAFIGNTAENWEQWLYSKLDFSKIVEMLDKRINKAILHIPQYNKTHNGISAFKVASRFCSFGSTWENKISEKSFISDSTITEKYQNIDITNFLTDIKTGFITRSDGLILKPTIKNNTFSAIATADNYYTPQILEINYRLN